MVILLLSLTHNTATHAGSGAPVLATWDIRSKTSRERAVWKTLPVIWIRRKRSEWWSSSAHFYGTDIQSSQHRSNDKVIEEVNSYFSRWISYVASTTLSRRFSSGCNESNKPILFASPPALYPQMCLKLRLVSVQLPPAHPGCKDARDTPD
jgi:hypothetical protein